MNLWEVRRALERTSQILLRTKLTQHGLPLGEQKTINTNCRVLLAESWPDTSSIAFRTGDIEFPGVCAPVASLAVNFVSELIWWNPGEAKMFQACPSKTGWVTLKQLVRVLLFRNLKGVCVSMTCEEWTPLWVHGYMSWVHKLGLPDLYYKANPRMCGRISLS